MLRLARKQVTRHCCHMRVPTSSITTLSLSAQCDGRALRMSAAVIGANTPIVVSSPDTDAGIAVYIFGPSPDVRFGDQIALLNLNSVSTPAFLTTAGSVSSVTWQRLETPILLAPPPREWQVEAAGALGSVAPGTPLAPGIQFKLTHVLNPVASLAMRAADASLTLGISSCSAGSPLQPLLVSFNRPTPALVLQPQPWWSQLVDEAIQLPDWWIEAWAPSWGAPPPWWRPHGRSAYKICPGGFIAQAHAPCPPGPFPVPGCPAHWIKCRDGNCRPSGGQCDCPPGQQWCAFSGMCQHVGTRCTPAPAPWLPRPTPPRPNPPVTPCLPGSKPCPGGCCPFEAPCPSGQRKCPDGKCQRAGVPCEGSGLIPSSRPPTPVPLSPPSLDRVNTHRLATIPGPFTPFGRRA